MGIVGGLDVHRRQITFDYVDECTGVVRRGRAPAHRELLRRWLASEVTERPARFAVEACTGWRFVVEELTVAGIRGASGGTGGYCGCSGAEAPRED
jgi:transposase